MRDKSERPTVELQTHSKDCATFKFGVQDPFRLRAGPVQTPCRPRAGPVPAPCRHCQKARRPTFKVPKFLRNHRIEACRLLVQLALI